MYTAELRLPPSLTHEEREERVAIVLGQVSPACLPACLWPLACPKARQPCAICHPKNTLARPTTPSCALFAVDGPAP